VFELIGGCLGRQVTSYPQFSLFLFYQQTSFGSENRIWRSQFVTLKERQVGVRRMFYGLSSLFLGFSGIKN
jgi:hypothetical protein